MEIYELRQDGDNYQHLSSDADWKFDLPFIRATKISHLTIPTVWRVTLDEDIADEIELVRIGELGNPQNAHARAHAGVGDCAYVDNISAPVFSARARAAIGDVLEAAGQLFKIPVDGDEFFIFNCTNVIDAVDQHSSIVYYHSGGRPSKFERLVFQPKAIAAEYIFKIHWPPPPDRFADVDYSKIPPPLPIFVTERFVELVRKNRLTGFRFEPYTA